MAPSNNPDIDLRPMQQNGAYVHRPRAEEGSQRRSFGESQASTDAARVSNENHDGQDPGRGVDYQRAETSSSLGWELRYANPDCSNSLSFANFLAMAQTRPEEPAHLRT